jgi:hypothetical protein
VVSSPFRISVYDKDYDPQDWVGAPLELHATLRDDEPSILALVLDDDDEQVVPLTTTGARLVVEYQADPTDPDEWVHVISGLVSERTGQTGIAGTRTFEVWDDRDYVLSIKGWPNPAGTIAEQGDEAAYDTRTGPAETVVKGFVTANATRLGLPITCATDLARGDDVEIAMRNHPLKDRLFPAVTQAGVLVTARQSGAGIVVDCFEPPTYPATLTEASGVVQSGSFSVAAPTVTRVVVGGAGEGTARMFVERINAALESEWGVIVEGFVDARNSTTEAGLNKHGDRALAEGGAKAGVSAVLSETEDFRYGVAFNLGDIVSVQLDGAPVISDRVREVQIDWTASGGLLIEPRVGEVATTARAITNAAIRQLAARTRDQDVRS